MAQRAAKRPSSGEGFGVDEEDRLVPPPDAKMPRNVGNADVGSRQQQCDGSSSILGSAKDVDLASDAKDDSLTRVTDLNDAEVALAVLAAQSTQLSICWICKRKFVSMSDLETHTLYSRRHISMVRRYAGSA